MFSKANPNQTCITDLNVDMWKIIFNYLNFSDKSKIIRTCNFFTNLVNQDISYVQHRAHIPIKAQEYLTALCDSSLKGIYSYHKKTIDTTPLTPTFGYGTTGYKRQLYYSTLLNCQDSTLLTKAAGLYCIFALEGGQKLKKYIRNATSAQHDKLLSFIDKRIPTPIDDNLFFLNILKNMIKIGFNYEEKALQSIATKIHDLQNREDIKQYIRRYYGEGTGAFYNQINDEDNLKRNLNQAICDIQKEYDLMINKSVDTVQIKR